MSIAPAPWKLCSNALERNFQIVGADGIPIATICTQNSALVKPWHNKRTPPKKLWERIATPREQDNARLLEASTELLEVLQQLKEAVEYTPLGVRGQFAVARANQLIHKLTGEQ
jgi:hypothetical protein